MNSIYLSLIAAIVSIGLNLAGRTAEAIFFFFAAIIILCV